MPLITLEELHQSVWEKPLSKLAKDWGVNATALGKLCDSENVPRPGGGYWTQVATGKDITMKPLPTQIDNAKMIDLTCLQAQKKGKKKSLPISKINLKAPKALHKPHRLTVIAKEKYHKPTFEYDQLMIGAWQGDTFQVAVSHEQFPRAIRIMDTLLKYFDKQGWMFKAERINGQRIPTNVVTVDGHHISFKLREKSKQTMRNLNKEETADKAAGRYVYYEKVNMPTGNLMLILSEYVDGTCQTSFIDKPDFKVEDNLGAFIESILIAVEYNKQRKIERQKEEQQREIKREDRRQFDSLVDEEVSRIAFLFEQYEDWQKTEKAREFVRAVKARMLSHGELSENQQDWLNWAEAILTVNDPVERAIELADTPRKVDTYTSRAKEIAISQYVHIK